jgi:hypothetical protein
MFLEISFDVTDPDAVEDASAVDNGSLYISDTETILGNVETNIPRYGTLEENMWTLDGTIETLPDVEQEYNGFISSVISKSDGTFDNVPIIDIDFDVVHTPLIPGMTISWGTGYSEFAEDFNVTAYNGSIAVAQARVRNNNSVKSIVYLDMEGYDKIRIEVLKWCLPYHRARISKCFIGINKVYTKKDITQFSQDMTVDTIGATTPMSKVNFSVDNTTDEYNPNNISGMSKYLIARQPLNVRFGLKMNNGDIEYIPSGIFYLSEWDAPQNGLDANFIACDLLEFLRKTYYKGQYHPEGITMYDLAVEVLTDASLPTGTEWIIDESLKSILTVAPLPLCTHAECLQYIAQASCCVLYTDRKGILHIEKISESTTDYKLTSFNMFERPEISLQKPLLSVSTKVYNYFVDKVGETLFEGKVTLNGTQTIVITYSSRAVNVSAVVEYGTLMSAEYYANACYLTVNCFGEVSITVTGDVLSISDSALILNNSDEGETETVENPLITSTAVATSVVEWVANWLNKRKSWKLGSWRADPRLDATDIVESSNKYGTDIVRITNIKYSYTGAFKASAEGRVIS